ncbi:MAG: outer membrane beta-barrel family protein, partial [Tannerella sp.]|jgi:hypothetical protein|nr:outer membrane beta-barrel family protein [Tannerella sp.]
MEASWLLSDRISADLGYSNSWRMYASESSHGKGFFDYNEDRHIVFAYLSSALSSGINIKSGLGVEMIRIRNRNSIDRLTYVMPRLNVRYRASSALEMEMNYTAVSHYPVMYQLSPMNIKIDSFLTQAGNPGLMPSLRHTASLRFRWKDRLTVEPAFHYTLNAVSESYMKSNYRLYRTFRNINTEEFAVYGGYGRSVGRYVRLAGSLTFYHGKTAAGGMENAVSGWLAGAEAGYYHPDGHFGVLLGFYRNMKKNVLWQGYQMLGKDNWLLEVNRMFPRTGIAVTLSWIPPLPYGIRKEQVKRMDTPLYSETTGIHLGAYHNTLLLKMNFRFGTGIKPANGNPASVRTEERQERTAGF